MIHIIGYNMGGKGVDFGVVTDPATVVKSAIFLTDKPVEINDYCLIDDRGFFNQEEQRSLLYILVNETLKKSS